MVFYTFFNFSLNLAIRSSWSEPQSAPGLVFADCIEVYRIGCKNHNRSDFGLDHLVVCVCRIICCVVGRACLLWPVRSLGRTVLSYVLLHSVPRPNLSVTPGVSWFPTFAFQSPIMKRISFLGLVLQGLIGLHRTVQLQLLQHYWLGHRLGSLWYWMVCLGNEQRSFCHFRDCIQELHFKLFCWPWWPLHFF